MQKVWYSLLVIGIVLSIVAGSGAIAYFSDVETSTGNTFTAGTLDLKLSNDGTTYTDGVTATWTASNMAPGDTGTATLYIKNAGSLDGNIDLSGITVTNSENGMTEPEAKVDDVDIGEMSANLKIQLWLDAINNGKVDTDLDGNLKEESVYPVGAIGEKNPGKGVMGSISGSYDLDELISSGSVKYLAMAWELPSDTSNVVQTDSATLNMTVELDQTAD